MALKNQVPNVYSVGLRSVGSYQVSGTPWVTGSATVTELATGKTIRFSLPYVTKSFTVINTGVEDLRVHLSAGNNTSAISSDGGAGVTNSNVGTDDVQSKHHYITVQANNGSVTMDVKCKEIYLSNHSGGSTGTGYEIFAELTNIPTGSMFALTGSGITG
jgi:hypothetical protein